MVVASIGDASVDPGELASDLVPVRRFLRLLRPDPWAPAGGVLAFPGTETVSLVEM